MADGDIGAPVDTLEFSLTDITYPKIIHVSGDMYAVVYSDADIDGQIITIDITDGGLIGAAVIDSLEFDAADCQHPDIIHVSGDIYAIAYLGTGNVGRVVTVQVEADGTVGAAIIDSLNFEAAYGAFPDIIRVNEDVYAIAYTGPGNDGFLCTVQIETDGQIFAAVIDSLEFDVLDGKNCKLLKVVNNMFAIAYQGGVNKGMVTTLFIADNGDIGAAVIDSLEFDGVIGGTPTFCLVSGDIYAIAYNGVDGDGFLCTVQIETDGQIGAAVIDSLEFDGVSAIRPDMLLLGSGIVAIAYSGVDGDGFLCTVQIETDGQIGAAVIDSLEFDGVGGDYIDVIHVSGDQYAIAYSGADLDGFITTPTIETPSVRKVKHLLMVGVG